MGVRSHVRVGGRRSFRIVAVAGASLLVCVPGALARNAFDSRRLDRELRTEPGVLAVLVERDDKLLFERYYRGSKPTVQLPTFSITKGVTSTLIGVALAQGKLRSLDQRLAQFFPKEVRAAPDPRVRKITVRQLLTMTAGYTLVPVVLSDHWVETLIRRPLGADPGSAFSYDDGSYHLLSAIVSHVTGLSAERFAQRVLFGPLGVRAGRWDSDHEGYSRGDTGLQLRARGLLRLGELYLHEGRWDRRQVIPVSYVRATTKRHSGLGGGLGYGYGWWILTQHRPAAFAALGYGGQAVAVFPSLRAVVVIQGSGDDHERVLYRLVLPELLIR
jgi:CubicO group peptidase (beta-lactamase class C family)